MDIELDFFDQEDLSVFKDVKGYDICGRFFFIERKDGKAMFGFNIDNIRNFHIDLYPEKQNLSAPVHDPEQKNG